MALSATLVALAVLAGCSGDSGAGSGDTAPGTGQQVADGTSFDALSPLTGQVLEGDAAARPVLAVKMDNSGASAPQVGLGSADLVAEELVEGGITRLAVFYQSRMPREVGPVRSMRATDIGIVQPLGAALVASGAAPQTNARLKDAGITTYVEGAAGFHRATDRTAPYNLFVDLHDAWLAPLGFTLASPRDGARRGGHVSLGHPDAWPICRALIERAGVVPDFREADGGGLIRFAFPALYTRFADVVDAAARTRDLVAAGEHRLVDASRTRVT